MNFKNKKIFILIILLIIGLTISLGSVSAGDIQDSANDDASLASVSAGDIQDDSNDDVSLDAVSEDIQVDSNDDVSLDAASRDIQDNLDDEIVSSEKQEVLLEEEDIVGSGDGDDILSDGEQTTPKETNLSVTADPITVGSDANFDISLKDCDGADLDGSVVLNLSGDNLPNGISETVDVSGGAGNKKIPNLQIGTYQYIATFAGNESYAPSTASGTLEVLGVKTVLSLTASEITYGSDAKFSISLKDGDGNGITDKVTLVLPNGNVTVDVTGGSGNYTLSSPDAGTYSIKAVFAGNETYANSTDTASLKVNKMKTTLSLTVSNIKVGKDAKISISLKDGNGKGITGKVTLTIKGTDHSVSVSNGAGSYTFEKPAAGTYSIAAKYGGDNNHQASSDSASLKVEKFKTELSVSAKNVVLGKDATIKVTLKDENGNSLSGTVSLTVNGKSYKVTVSSGKGSKTISGLGIKTYKVTAKFAATAKYLADSAKTSFAVEPTKVSTLSQLKKAINNEETKQIQLTKDISLGSTITIKNRSPIVIDGAGHTINGKGHRIFEVYGTTAQFKNIVLKGAKYNWGAAIYSSSSKLKIVNSKFISNVATGNANVAGGAIYSTSGSLSVTGTKFSSNVANSGKGGAVAINSKNAVFNKCTFTSNKAKNGQGGAIACFNKGLKITGCTFKSNSATSSGKCYGGALDLMASSPNIQSSTFTGNIVKSHGGAILVSQDVVGAKINKCTFTSNQAKSEDGGAISWAGGSGSVTNCKFVSNKCKQDGGAIDFYNKVRKSAPKITIKNCLFNKNKASKSGAGVFLGIKIKFTVANCNFTGNTKPKFGAGAFFEGSGATVTNCIFKSNVASQSGGGFMANAGGKANLKKCTFTSNKAYIGGAVVNKAKGITVTNCKFTKNTASRSGGTIAVQNGKNVIKSNTIVSGKAIFGGGFFQAGGKSTLTKNTIKNCVASKAGGAAFIAAGKFTQSANKFSGNKGGKKPNVFKK